MGYWEKREAVNELARLRALSCGLCAKWMKCTCPREGPGKRGPAVGDTGCGEFVRRADVQRKIDSLKSETEESEQ